MESLQAIGTVEAVDAMGVDLLVEIQNSRERFRRRLSCSDYLVSNLPIKSRVALYWDRADPNGTFRADPIIEDMAEPVSDIERDRLREIYGIGSASKVLMVVGQNPPAHYEELKARIKDRLGFHEKALFNRLALKTAGFGECLASLRLPNLLYLLGVQPHRVKSLVCDIPMGDTFNPSDYSDFSILFLGSPKSNRVLREHYWSRMGFDERYLFDESALRVKSDAGDTQVFEQKANFEHLELGNKDEACISDHFVVLKARNPDAKPGVEAFCYVLAGVGTVGTGYAGVCFSTRKFIRSYGSRLQQERAEFVCRVDMKGLFNPRDDAVFVEYNGEHMTVGTGIERLLLPNAVTAKTVWEKEEEIDE